MRISRRTSGGRGEYEISENDGDITSVQVIGKQLHIKLNQFQVRVDSFLSGQGGKRRIRLNDRQTGIHPHRQAAIALMMPQPVRADDAMGAGEPVLQTNRYVIHDLILKDVQLGAQDAVLPIDKVIFGNRSNNAEELSAVQRMKDVEKVWLNKNRFPDEIARIIDQHEIAVKAGNSLNESDELLIHALQKSVSKFSADLDILYSSGTDVLPALLSVISEVKEPPIPIEQIEPEEKELKRRTAKEWKRWAICRGAASSLFRQEVRKVYKSTCCICGACLPSTTANRVPGVDAAHILPWAHYDLDEVSNGLCLCKLHHWAFDERLLEIRFENGAYHVVIPTDVLAALGAIPNFTMDLLKASVGPIAEHRLPADKSHWPSAQYLKVLNDTLG